MLPHKPDEFTLEDCVDGGGGAEAAIARMALCFPAGFSAARLAEMVLDIEPIDSRRGHKLLEIARLLRRRPEMFATLRETGLAVRHERDETETDAGVVMRLAAGFDAAAAVSAAASVQLSSLGDEERLSAATQEIAEWLDRQGFTGADREILDIGCGIGRFESALAKACGRLIGIDISQEMLSIAASRCKGLANVEFRNTSGLDLAGFADASFDGVLAVDSFPYLVLAHVAEQHFSETARVLKRPGWLVLLNYSYRGSHLLDREEVGRLATQYGMQLIVDGERPFRHWDGVAFVLTLSATAHRT
ncbi:MAG: class I SAM-dependent methyltransferase [Mesorhizobium sp.]|nr:MAG: class I SAM-dependent methyltransferase [Mesorhizobium sp.]